MMALAALPARPAVCTTTGNAPNRRFICDWPGCDKAYVRRGILRNHVNAEHLQIILTCSQCGIFFRYENDLKQHNKRIHQQLRLYVCQFDSCSPSGCACGRSFATSSELYRHQRGFSDKQSRSRPHNPRSTTQASNPLSENTGNHAVTHAGRQIAKLCHGPARAGPLDELEETITAIRGYVEASFQSGTWILAKDTGVVQSKKLATYERRASFVLFDSLRTSLAFGRYSVASIQLNRACQAAGINIQSEDPEYLSEIVLEALNIIAIEAAWKPLVMHAYSFRARYLHALSHRIHGPQHPWTLITRLLAGPAAHVFSKESMLMIMRVLQASYSKSLGADSIGLLRFTIDAAAYFDDGSALLQRLMEQSIYALGRWHPVSRHCFHEFLCALWRENQLQSLDKELDVAAGMLQDKLKREECVAQDFTLVFWRYFMAVDLEEWHYAAEMLSTELIPHYIVSYGEDDVALDGWLLRLEYVLEASGQLERLQEAEKNSYARMERIAAQVADEDYVQELEWLASRSQKLTRASTCNEQDTQE